MRRGFDKVYHVSLRFFGKWCGGVIARSDCGSERHTL